MAAIHLQKVTSMGVTGSRRVGVPQQLGCSPHEREEVINNAGAIHKIILVKQSCPFFS